MNYLSSTGSQFIGSIDPRLLDLDLDVDAATYAQGQVNNQLLSPDTASSFNEFGGEPSTVNPNDVFRTPDRQDETPTTSEPFEVVRRGGPPRRNRGSYKRLGYQNTRSVHQQQQTPSGVDWRKNNRFAPLHPDYTSPSNDRSFHQQYNGNSVVDRFGRQAMPLASGSRAPNSSGFGRHGRHSLQHAAPVEDIDQWNRESYNPGDRMFSEQLAPPTPTPSHRHQRGNSVTRSVSTHTMTCEVCNRSFDTKYNLNRHWRIHGPKTHICDICGKGFVFEKDLRRHNASKSHNTKDGTQREQKRPFYCPVARCEYNVKGFARNDHLKRHMDSLHRGIPPTPPTTRSFASERR